MRNRRDRRGYPVHLWCGVIGLAGALSYDAAAEVLVWWPVIACGIRLAPARRSVLQALGLPVALAALAVVGFAALSLLWSPDPALGFEEWAKFRHCLVALAIWPLIDHRGRLVAALAVGLALGHLTQIGHAIGVSNHVEWLCWPREANRNSGWWDPVVGGSLITAGVGLHLPALLWGRGRWRLVGALGTAAALVGVIATGTRGAWLASGALVAIGVAVALLRALRPGGLSAAPPARARAMLLVLGVVVVGGVLGAIVAGPTVLERGQRGVAEVQRAVEQRNFNSDTGRRLLLWLEAWRAFRSHPVAGVGAGGLRAWATPDAQARGIDPALLLDHAHGLWAHLLATQGVVGGGLWVVLLGLAIGMGLRGLAREHAGAGPGEAYAGGPAWALIGLTLAGTFDSVQINSQTSMLLWILIALCAMRAQPASVDGSAGRPGMLAP